MVKEPGTSTKSWGEEGQKKRLNLGTIRITNTLAVPVRIVKKSPSPQLMGGIRTFGMPVEKGVTYIRIKTCTGVFTHSMFAQSNGGTERPLRNSKKGFCRR